MRAIRACAVAAFLAMGGGACEFGVAAPPTIVSATGGAIPVPAPIYDFRLFPATTLDPVIITDQNISTGVLVHGLDGVTIPSNGAVADGGAFALFTFQIEPGTPRVEIQLHAQTEYTSPGDFLSIVMLDLRDNSFRSVLFNVPAGSPRWFNLAFDTNGNNGNVPQNSNMEISNVVSASGRMTFAVQFSYLNTLNIPGHVIGHVNEVGVVVPEPSVCGCVIVAIAMSGLARRRRASEQPR